MDIQVESVAEFKTGHGTVGTSAAQVSDLAFRATKYVKIKADLGNTDNVFIGHDASVTASTGYFLDAGEEVEIPIDSLDKVWIIADAADQGYSWLVI